MFLVSETLGLHTVLSDRYCCTINGPKFSSLSSIHSQCQSSIFINISQLQAIISKRPAAMIREDLACHDEPTRVALCEQSVKFFFTHSRSLQGVQFVEPSPIGFVPQIHALVMFDSGFEDGRVVEICDAIKKRLDDGVF
jgi:hypothetical protein